MTQIPKGNFSFGSATGYSIGSDIGASKHAVLGHSMVQLKACQLGKPEKCDDDNCACGGGSKPSTSKVKHYQELYDKMYQSVDFVALEKSTASWMSIGSGGPAHHSVNMVYGGSSMVYGGSSKQYDTLNDIVAWADGSKPWPGHIEEIRRHCDINGIVEIRVYYINGHKHTWHGKLKDLNSAKIGF